MSESDAYKVLQVSHQATAEEIKAAFRRLARQYHPDLNPDHPASARKFREICEAYQLLSQASPSGERSSPSSLSEKDYYVRGVEKVLEKDYRGAEECFTQAIRMNSSFLEAYLKRSEARYKQGDDRGVLEDCFHILQTTRSAQAYYYQGRSRMRLGYPQSAVEAYTQSIRLQEEAQTYYHRGLAYHELGDSQAIRDIQTAASLFQTQGDRSGYLLAKATLKKLKPRWEVLNVATNVKMFIAETFSTLTWIANPVGGIPDEVAVSKRAAVGILCVLIANFCFVWGVYLGSDLPLVSLSAIGIVPFVSIVIISAIARFLLRRHSSLADELFLAGATMLPLGGSALFWAILPISLAVILLVFACCYTVLLLYGGFTHISRFSEAQAAFLMPTVLLSSGWFTYTALTVIG